MNDRQKEQLLSLLALLMSKGEIDSALSLPGAGKIAKTISFDTDVDVIVDELKKDVSQESSDLLNQFLAARRFEAEQWRKATLENANPIPSNYPLLKGLAGKISLGWKENEPLPDFSALIARTMALAHVKQAGSEKFPKTISKLEQDAIKGTAASAKSLEYAAALALEELKKRNNYFPQYDFNLFLSQAERKFTEIRQSMGRGLSEGKTLFPDIPDQIVLDALMNDMNKKLSREWTNLFIDAICGWPAKNAAQYILELLEDPRCKDRAETILLMRFSDTARDGDWKEILSDAAEESSQYGQKIKSSATSMLFEVLHIWSQKHRIGNSDSIKNACAEHLHASKLVTPNKILELIDPEERIHSAEIAAAIVKESGRRQQEDINRNRANASETATESAARTIDEGSGTVPVVSQAPSTQKIEKQPAKPPEPSRWDTHIQPFFVENWYMFAGIIMMVAGSSLLAYYTWDKHWVIRYTIVPFIFGSFTCFLAWSGSKLENRDKSFSGMAAMLRGASVSLLPVNFMAIALISSDPAVSPKIVAVPLMALAYLCLAGWGLYKCCSLVHPRLGTALGIPLLLLNFLVALGPVAKSLGLAPDEDILRAVLATGFYAGMAVLILATVYFSDKILTPEMAAKKIVPLFFGLTLTVTFLQVFAWEHGFLKLLPKIDTYAPAIILTGWIVLYAERRAIKMSGDSALHGAESFLGFACVILGLLMGNADSWFRVLCFVIAGIVWLQQGIHRKNELHCWIALTLITLGVASVGLLEEFNPIWRPVLGIAAAAGFGIAALFLKKPSNEIIHRVSVEIQGIILHLTAVVAVLSQLLHNSNPYLTATFILVTAAMTFYRAYREQNSKWIYSAAAMLILSLPYLGCIDVSEKNIHGNCMDFGLGVISILWLILTRLEKKHFVSETRSTVVLIYGAIATAAVLLRLVIDGPQPEELLRDIPTITLVTPPLIIISLGFCAFCSRSLVPAFLAAAVVTIAYFEMKPALSAIAEYFSWGSGFGSATTAIALSLATFGIEKLPFLKNLKGGDKIFGTMDFPLIRRDHTLFTLPVLATALYLAIKVIVHNGIIGFAAGNSGINTSFALMEVGVFWMILSIHIRAFAGAPASTYFGWACVLAGFSAYHWKSPGNHHWDVPVFAFFVAVQSAYWIWMMLGSRFNWIIKIFKKPSLQILKWLGLLAMIACTVDLACGRRPMDISLLMFFLAAQMIWHGWTDKNYVFGTALFFWILVASLSFFAEGRDLVEQIVSQSALMPLLTAFLLVHVVGIAIEFSEALRNRLKYLFDPMILMTVMASAIFLLIGLAESLHPTWDWSLRNRAMNIILLLLSSRALGISPFAIGASFIMYVLSCGIVPGMNIESVWNVISEPRKLSLFALALGLAATSGKLLGGKMPWLFAGRIIRIPLVAPGVNVLGKIWFVIATLILAFFSEGRHSTCPELRNSAAQVISPYLGAVATLLCAYTAGATLLYAAASGLFVLGNIHLIHVFAGNWLIASGLSHMHVATFGIAASMLLFRLFRFLYGTPKYRFFLDTSSLVCGGIILCILPVNYFISPDIATMTPCRFISSGIVALLAALFYRNAAREPLSQNAEIVRIFESVYHFGIAMAIWCAVLLIPPMRTPQTALVALGLPTLYFLGCAEFASLRNHPSLRSYRDSATVMSFAILALYIFRAVFQMMFFPGSHIDTNHYHYNSPVVLAISIVMLRLHALGGSRWLAFYGGISLICSAFFGITALPNTSPFGHQITAAWVAITMAHFWTVATYAKSPLRSFIQFFGKIDDAAWKDLRRMWGYCLLAFAQLVMIAGLIKAFDGDTLKFAPLLAAGATVFIHHGMIRRSPLYFILAAIELLVALHSDYFVESYLKKDYIILVLLALWAALVLSALIARKKMPRDAVFISSLLFIGISLMHIVFQHHPWSVAGLWAFVGAALLTALTPSPVRGKGLLSPIAGAIPAIAIPWIVYFSQAPIEAEGLMGFIDPWAIIITSISILALSASVNLRAPQIFEFCRKTGGKWMNIVGLDAFEFWAGNSLTVLSLWLWILTPLALFVQVIHYGNAFPPHEFITFLVLVGGLTALWYHEGVLRRSMISIWMSEASAFLFFIIVRRHLSLTVVFWKCEYDIWAALMASFTLASAKKLLDTRPAAERIPAITSLCLMPLVSMGWVIFNGLGVNTALIVIGLNSMIFVFMGKDDKESPYNIAGVAGFLCFVLTVFWGKLHLSMFHAYVIPTGLAVMVLLHLFREKVRADIRNQVRFIVIMAMIISAAYYAFADKTYSWLQIAILGILCIASMGLGSLLRVRVYLFLGFGGVIATLAIALTKAFTLYAIDRNIKMTIIGTFVFVTGAVLVGGAVLIKTHSEQIQAFIAKCKKLLGDWE